MAKSNSKTKKGDISPPIQLEITNNTENGIAQKEQVFDIVENTEKDFGIKKPLYLEIYKGNLLQYISAGIIYPSIYSNQKAFSDPQSSVNNALVLTNGRISNDNNDNICIQISSSALDEKLLSIKSGYALYHSVIPISRILKIFVANSNIKKSIIDSALTRDGGLLPDGLLEIGLPKFQEIITLIDENIQTYDWSKELKLYDKILGLITGTRNYSLITANYSDSIKSISDHTFYAINAIDKDFSNNNENIAISDFYTWLFSKSCPDEKLLLKWIFNRVLDDSNFTDKDTEEFEKLCYSSNVFKDEIQQLNDIFATLRNSIKRKTVFGEILKLQSKHHTIALYIFAYLRIYGSTQSPEIVRTDLAKLGTDKYKEYAFAIINFFFGYKLLRNSEERLALDNKKMEGVFDNLPKPNIKFELTTRFDYKIIDNVFDFVFGSEIQTAKNNYGQYSNIESLILKSKSVLSGYSYKESLVHGKIYQILSKDINPFDDILVYVNKLPDDIFAVSDFGLVCYRIGLKMHLFSMSDLLKNDWTFKKTMTYSKKDLIDAIKNNKIDIEEIKQRIVLSQKHKEI